MAEGSGSEAQVESVHSWLLSERAVRFDPGARIPFLQYFGSGPQKASSEVRRAVRSRLVCGT